MQLQYNLINLYVHFFCSRLSRVHARLMEELYDCERLDEITAFLDHSSVLRPANSGDEEHRNLFHLNRPGSMVLGIHEPALLPSLVNLLPGTFVAVQQPEQDLILGKVRAFSG